MNIDEYSKGALATIQPRAKSAPNYVYPLGLVGELGGLCAVYKKELRDGKRAGQSYKAQKMEEIGDILWYVNALCCHHGLNLRKMMENNLTRTGCKLQKDQKLSTFEQYQQSVGDNVRERKDQLLDFRIVGLTENISEIHVLLKEKSQDISKVKEALEDILWYCAAVCAHEKIDFVEAARQNLIKVKDCYGGDSDAEYRLLDEKFAPDEQFPRKLRITFFEHGENNPHVKISINGTIIGDRLTDNSHDDDGYRYHDAFHFAYMAILGWSPVMRKLLNRKRKSFPEIDEVQDGARAMITEEAISAYVFEHAKKPECNFFQDGQGVDTELLDAIKSLTRNYEVNIRSQKDWREAIKKGYRIYNKLKENKGGDIIIDLEKRNISYETIENKSKHEIYMPNQSA